MSYNWDTAEFDYEDETYLVTLSWDTEPKAIDHRAWLEGGRVKEVDIMGEFPSELTDYEVLEAETGAKVEDKELAEEVALAAFEEMKRDWQPDRTWEK